MIIHPLHTNIPKPERFTWPFCYEPHPLCLLACDEVKQEIERIGPKEGKMFGVLVVEVNDGLGFLAACICRRGRDRWAWASWRRILDYWKVGTIGAILYRLFLMPSSLMAILSRKSARYLRLTNTHHLKLKTCTKRCRRIYNCGYSNNTEY